MECCYWRLVDHSDSQRQKKTTQQQILCHCWVMLEPSCSCSPILCCSYGDPSETKLFPICDLLLKLFSSTNFLRQRIHGCAPRVSKHHSLSGEGWLHWLRLFLSCSCPWRNSLLQWNEILSEGIVNVLKDESSSLHQYFVYSPCQKKTQHLAQFPQSVSLVFLQHTPLLDWEYSCLFVWSFYGLVVHEFVLFNLLIPSAPASSYASRFTACYVIKNKERERGRKRKSKGKAAIVLQKKGHVIYK